MTNRERDFANLGFEYAEGIDLAKVIIVPSTGREIRKTERGTWESQPWNDNYWTEFTDLLDAVRFATRPAVATAQPSDRAVCYTAEFHADFTVPIEIVRLFELGKLDDTSWHNDVCPSFASASNNDLRIWIDHVDPEQREVGGKRFVVTITHEDGSSADLFGTDDLPELLANLKAQHGISDPLRDTIERAKREVAADVASGLVPRGVESFAELHQYVDANGYGGAFEQPWNDTDEHLNFWNAVQDAVDRWIKAGGLTLRANLKGKTS
jgi:hypothetical protein